MYERTKGRSVVGSGLSEKFPVNIGLRQGSALSLLLFIMVMELIRKISTKDVLRKMMYADDLAMIAESKQELQEVLEEWTANEPGEDRSDVGWTPERGVEHQKRQKYDVGPGGSKCLEKGRGSHVGQKKFEKAERESPENVCYTSMPVVWRQWC